MIAENYMIISNSSREYVREAVKKRLEINASRGNINSVEIRQVNNGDYLVRFPKGVDFDEFINFFNWLKMPDINAQGEVTGWINGANNSRLVNGAFKDKRIMVHGAVGDAVHNKIKGVTENNVPFHIDFSSGQRLSTTDDPLMRFQEPSFSFKDFHNTEILKSELSNLGKKKSYLATFVAMILVLTIIVWNLKVWVG